MVKCSLEGASALLQSASSTPSSPINSPVLSQRNKRKASVQLFELLTNQSEDFKTNQIESLAEQRRYVDAKLQSNRLKEESRQEEFDLRRQELELRRQELDYNRETTKMLLEMLVKKL